MSAILTLLDASIGMLGGQTTSTEQHITLDEARALLVRIAQAAERGEIESAQLDEHRLLTKTIKAIASGAKEPQRLAAVALLATDIRFQPFTDAEIAALTPHGVFEP